MFDEQFIKRLQKYKVPYRAERGRNGELTNLSYPVPAYTYDERLRWLRRKLPGLYYKITGECRERPRGYNWYRRPRPIKKRYRLVWTQKEYAVLYAWIDGKWTKLDMPQKPIIDGRVDLTYDEGLELMHYERLYVDHIAVVSSTKQPVRRLAAPEPKRYQQIHYYEEAAPLTEQQFNSVLARFRSV